MCAIVSVLSVLTSIASAQTAIWTDSLTASTSWTTTNAVITSSTWCPFSSPCLNIQGSGGVASTTIDTTSYESIQFRFYLSVNLGTNDECQLSWKPTSSSTWILLAQYSANPASPTTVSLSAASTVTSIDIRMVNTGKQSTDACYLDEVSVLGSLIILPTTSTTTTTTTSTTTSTTSTTTLTPTPTTSSTYTSPTPRPTTYSRYNRDCDDEDGDCISDVNFFSSWSLFGIYVACITAFGCFAFCPWFVLIYLWLKNTVINMIGKDGTGMVLNRRLVVRRSKRSVTYIHMIDYKYTVNDREYFDEQRLAHPDDCQMVQQGTVIPVKYLRCYPALNMKEHGSGGGCCYCSVFCNCCIWGGMAAGICVAGFIVTSILAENFVDCMLLIIVGTVIFCAIPCCVCGAAKDRAQPDQPKRMKVIRPCPEWCYNTPRYHHDNLGMHGQMHNNVQVAHY
eukprot:CAMPEP_0197037138 /NCGR_PEP_ID=MMETSP1384-20130603/14423_1 /TAXON_ID=29189 /ORGANISM="Ammonia sp." /LENGTH=450 /DNA_ID=CAMNT_0042467401 /DNA_START=48 /DNA_END=1400 /DNA_ORIENTATION=+